MTHPRILRKKIVGYCGMAVGAGDVFRWRVAMRGEYFEGKILDRRHGVSKDRRYKEWRKVTITIEVQP